MMRARSGHADSVPRPLDANRRHAEPSGTAGPGLMVRCAGVYIWRVRGAWRGRWYRGGVRAGGLWGRV